MNSIIKNSLINSIGTILYIALIASFMFYSKDIEGRVTLLMPIVMLMLFVFSAAFTGALIFGKPVIWYLDGKKQDAIILLVCTLGIFLIATLLALFILIAYF